MTSWEVDLNAFLVSDRRASRGSFARVSVCQGVLVLRATQNFGQKVALSPSSAITTLGLGAALTLSKSTLGDIQPAVLEWTVQYLADLTANAGKRTICSYGVSAANCLAWGENNTTIPDGAHLKRDDQSDSTARYRLWPNSESRLLNQYFSVRCSVTRDAIANRCVRGAVEN
jgi:hypothetical protein